MTTHRHVLGRPVATGALHYCTVGDRCCRSRVQLHPLAATLMLGSGHLTWLLGEVAPFFLAPRQQGPIQAVRARPLNSHGADHGTFLEFPSLLLGGGEIPPPGGSVRCSTPFPAAVACPPKNRPVDLALQVARNQFTVCDLLESHASEQAVRSGGVGIGGQKTPCRTSPAPPFDPMILREAHAPQQQIIAPRYNIYFVKLVVMSGMMRGFALMLRWQTE